MPRSESDAAKATSKKCLGIPISNIDGVIEGKITERGISLDGAEE